MTIVSTKHKPPFNFKSAIKSFGVSMEPILKEAEILLTKILDTIQLSSSSGYLNNSRNNPKPKQTKK